MIKMWKIWNFFKNIRNFLQLLFHIPEPTIKHRKLRFSKISWILTSKISHFSRFWAFLWLREGLECPKDDKNMKKIWKFFKIIRHFLQSLFEIPEPTIKYGKLRFSKISWVLTPKMGYFEAFFTEIYPSRIFMCPNPRVKFSKNLQKKFLVKNILKSPQRTFGAPRTSQTSKIL